MNELKLSHDVLESTNDGLATDKRHLANEIRDIR